MQVLRTVEDELTEFEKVVMKREYNPLQNLAQTLLQIEDDKDHGRKVKIQDLSKVLKVMLS